MTNSPQSRRGSSRPRRAAGLLRGFLAFCALLLAGCGGGGGDGGDDDGGGGGPMPGPGGAVTITGIAQYELPPPNPGCLGLNFNDLQLRPIRQATIQLLAAAGDTVLDSGITDDTGVFSLTGESGTNVYIRVRAELKRTGFPSWDVEARDNTVTATAAGAPLALPERPLYVLDTAPFDPGMVDTTHDVTARTGWNEIGRAHV